MSRVAAASPRLGSELRRALYMTPGFHTAPGGPPRPARTAEPGGMERQGFEFYSKFKGWHRGQRREDRPPITSLRIGAPQRRQGRPSRPYTDR